MKESIHKVPSPTFNYKVGEGIHSNNKNRDTCDDAAVLRFAIENGYVIVDHTGDLKSKQNRKRGRI